MIITFESNKYDWECLYSLYTHQYRELRYRSHIEYSFETSSKHAERYLLENYGIQIIPSQNAIYKGFAIFWMYKLSISFNIVDMDKYLIAKLSNYS